jgi:hypothetical protein
MHHYLRGLVLTRRGNDSAAIGEYRQAMTWPGYGYTRVDYELGRALLRAGRAREAADVLGRALPGLESTGLYVTRTEIRDALARAWDVAGVRDSALVHYRAVARAWQRADPPLRSRVDSIRARLAALEAR